MANLTITVDAETLKRARVRAIERGESVNAYLAEQLRRYANDDQRERQRQTAARLASIADGMTAGSGGQRWTRESLYEERRTR